MWVKVQTPTKGQFDSHLSYSNVYMTQHMVSHMVGLHGRLINLLVLHFYETTLLHTVPQALQLYSHMRLTLISYLGVIGNKSAANNAYISAHTFTINLL